MASLGLITITKDGVVTTKIIAGSNIKAGSAVADVLKKNDTSLTLRDIFELAAGAGFGDPEVDLVVMNEQDIYHECDEDISPLYRKTFFQPEFNPRWACGLSDYLEIISK